MVAGGLALIFVVAGVVLLSSSHRIQQRITGSLGHLELLDALAGDIHALLPAHQADLGTQHYQWPEQLDALKKRTAWIAERHGAMPAIDPVLQKADSLHKEIIHDRSQLADLHAKEAVLRIYLQRAQQEVDREVKRVHTALAQHSARINERWKAAQVLLITACLLAVIFAWLAGISNKLLAQSRQHMSQLDMAKKELERTNKELRETMLSKEEKEMMIKEIHHRVKNNLQIVKSLIRFQMDQVKDPKVTELFNECVNRVSAMALVHEQTYLSKDLANIDVNTYLAHLTRDLCHAYTIDTRLRLDIQIDIPTLGVDTLIPLGLLINEIISNSLKYAFRGRDAGTIFVHLRSTDDHGIHMRIGDDGVGLPDRTQWQNPRSLGMELIHTLSDQLDARMELEQGTGTVFVMKAHPKQVRRRA